MRWSTVLLATVLTVRAAWAQGAVGDREALQGTWTCAAMERNGVPVPPDRYKGGRLVVEGDRFTYSQDGRVKVQGVRTLDPGRSPKAFDDTHTSGPFKGKTYLGIYKLDGDTFTTCNGSAGQARPTGFATKPGSGLLRVVYKREKPGRDPP